MGRFAKHQWRSVTFRNFQVEPCSFIKVILVHGRKVISGIKCYDKQNYEKIKRIW